MSQTRRGMQATSVPDDDEGSDLIIFQSQPPEITVNTPPQGIAQPPQAAGPATTQLAQFSFTVPPKGQMYIMGSNNQMVLQNCTDEEHHAQVERMRTAAAQLLARTQQNTKKPQTREPRQASTDLPQVTKGMVQLQPGELVVSKITLYLTAALVLGLLIIGFLLGGILL